MEHHTCIGLHIEIRLYLLLWINDFKCNLHLLRSKNIVNMNISTLESCGTITELNWARAVCLWVLCYVQSFKAIQLNINTRIPGFLVGNLALKIPR